MTTIARKKVDGSIPAEVVARRAKAAIAKAVKVPEMSKVKIWTGVTEPKDSRRESVLRSVGAVMGSSGLNSLTMQSIANQLGITKGNLYYYFKDKQDILFQCRMRCMEVSLGALEVARKQVARKEFTVEEAVRTMLRKHILGILEDGMGHVLLTNLDDMDQPLRDRYIEARDQFELGLRKLIDLGKRRGEFQVSDSKLAGFGILGAINWIPKWYRTDGVLSTQEIATEMSNLLVKTVLPAAPAASDAKK